jgi:hypothetical protein
MKVVISRGVLTTIMILIHRMLLAMMQAELIPCRNNLWHTGLRSTSITTRFLARW